MKITVFFLTLFVGILTSSLYAQKIIWLDKSLKETTVSNAVYYKTDQKLDGEISYFYKNSAIYKKIFLVDGVKEGKFSEYYNSGELRITGKYVNGLREGNWKEYYKSGKIKKKGRYRKGHKVGIWKVFYKND